MKNKALSSRSRYLAAAIASLIAGPALADPPPIGNLPNVFCFRITDIERPVGGSATDPDKYFIEFEVLNWTGFDAAGLSLSLNAGTTNNSGDAIQIVDAYIDVDGRGGAVDTSFNDIPKNAADAASANVSDAQNRADGLSIHSGRGRGETDGGGNLLLPNDWETQTRTSTAVLFDAIDNTDGTPTGTEIPGRNLRFTGENNVPGSPGDTDATGDSRIDGGPGPFSPSGLNDPAYANGNGNSLDGFVVVVDGLDPGDVVSFNWNLLGNASGFFGAADAGPQAATIGGPGNCDGSVIFEIPVASDQCLFDIGSLTGDTFGFGTMSLTAVDPGNPMPGPVFVGNTGFVNAGSNLFYDNVWNVPNPATFGIEIGAGQVADFLNPADNRFGNTPNTALAPTNPAPLPGMLALFGIGILSLFGLRRRRA